MTVKERADEAWRLLRASTNERLREELRERVSELTGAALSEVEVTEEDGRLVASVEGIKFAPVIYSKVVTIKESVEGVTMKGVCPKCGAPTETEPLQSLGEVGRHLAAFEPQPVHLCLSYLLDNPGAKDTVTDFPA